MTSFLPYKYSRRRSAPQEIFQTFRSQFQNSIIEPEPVSITFNKIDRVNFASENLPISFSTLPHKRSEVRHRPNATRNNKNRHSWMPSTRVDLGGFYSEEGQHVLPSSFSRIENRNHRVPYYCNELFCKNEMEENNATTKQLKDENGVDDNDDQISKETIICCEQCL